MTIRMSRITIFTTLMLTTISGVASGATKITPALQKDTADSFTCRILNTGTKDTPQLTLSIIDSSANILSTTQVVASAGETSSVSYTGSLGIAYCKLDGKFSKSKVLVTFCLLQAGSVRCTNSVGDPGLK